MNLYHLPLLDELNSCQRILIAGAKDVKIQIEFNPAKVKAYRLIGYENRKLAKEDFADDKKDAGELGAGHSMTALYEIIPADSGEALQGSYELKYQETKISPEALETDEMMTVKLRYKLPDGEQSLLITHPVASESIPLDETSENFRFSAAVAEFGLLLRESPFRADASYEQPLQLAKEAKGSDEEGYRAEFIRLIETAELLRKTLD